jgi:hypothetical protein
MKDIIFEKRVVYGNSLNYPLTCREELQALTGSRTITNKHIQALKGLGFKVVEKSVYFEVAQ